MTVGLYASAEFRGWCAGNNVAQSMGKAGVCRDNAVAENFFAHLKTELYHHGFTSRLAARTSVMDYIESWYNPKRPMPERAADPRREPSPPPPDPRSGNPGRVTEIQR